MIGLIDVRRLNHWRRADLEAIVFAGHEGLPGNIAGDIVLGSRSSAKSIRFSIEQHDEHPFVVLSAEEHTRCTDVDVTKFMKFARFQLVREVTSGATTFARSFEIRAR